MLIPDQKLEAYLDSKADAQSVRQLCWEGVLHPRLFLKAIALERSDGIWQKISQNILKVLCLCFAATAVFFFAIWLWKYLYTPAGLYVLAFITVACGAATFFFPSKMHLTFSLCGAAGIGLLIFIPDVYFGVSTLWSERLLLWVVLLLFWASATKVLFVYVPVYLLTNAALYMAAAQIWLPTDAMSFPFFLGMMAVLNALCTILCESVFLFTGKNIPVSLRRTAFLCAAFPLIVPAFQAATGVFPFVSLTFFIVFGLCFFSAAVGVYAFLLSDMFSLHISVFSACVWAELMLFSLLKTKDADDAFLWMTFSFFSFLIVVTVVKMTLFLLQKIAQKRAL